MQISRIRLSHKTSRLHPRHVVVINDDCKKAIKEAMTLPYFTNVRELCIWNGVKNTDLAQIFGECHAISESGRYLVMERLDDITDADRADTPDVPEWVRDVYPGSFGRNSDGAIKLRDYGNTVLDLPTGCV